MFSLNESNRYYLYPYPTDMRKSFYTLSGLVTDQMGKNVRDIKELRLYENPPHGIWWTGNISHEIGTRVLPRTFY